MVIRYKCFETNSSSTHALCIGKDIKLKTPLELISTYKRSWRSNSYEIMDHYKEYLPITNEYVRKQLRKDFLSTIENYEEDIKDFKQEIKDLQKSKQLKINNKDIDKMYQNLIKHFEWYSKDKSKQWNNTDYFLSICESYCLNYMESNLDTILLRRIENLGRQFIIYETPMSKLNFIWTALCCYGNRDVLNDDMKPITKGSQLIERFIYLLESSGFKLKYMDTKLVESGTYIEQESYNKPKILSTINKDNKTYDIIGIETYGYCPIQEINKILNDEVLFFNLIFGESKIYTGSDEFDTFQDLDFNNYLYRLVGGSDSSNCNFENIHKYEQRKPLGTYINGNYETKIYEDGTRIRTLQPETIFYKNGVFKNNFFKVKELDIMDPQFPESIDLKITNYCENNCPFCYANSSKEGKHANLDFVKSIIDQMNPFTEIAIGGGNALTHPNLVDMLQYAKNKKVICNITLKDTDIINKSDLICNLIQKDLINQVGISPTTVDTLKQAINIVNSVSWDSFILHLVIGVHTKKFMEQIEKECLTINKVLFLGYKTKGKGKKYYNSNKYNVKQNIEEFKEMLNNNIIPIKAEIMAFDNLAIEQLALNMNKERYVDLYQGNDGKFSFYIDAVNQTYAKSSLSDIDEHFYKYTTLESILQDFKEGKE